MVAERKMLRTNKAPNGKEIRRARLAAGLTQDDLARLVRAEIPGLRTTGMTISFWECGHRKPTGPSAVALKRVLETLGG